MNFNELSESQFITWLLSVIIGGIALSLSIIMFIKALIDDYKYQKRRNR